MIKMTKVHAKGNAQVEYSITMIEAKLQFAQIYKEPTLIKEPSNWDLSILTQLI